MSKTLGVVIPVRIEPLEDGWHLAICDAIQGCHAEGETVAEALEAIEDVVRVLLELRLEDGLPLPDELRAFKAGMSVSARLMGETA